MIGIGTLFSYPIAPAAVTVAVDVWEILVPAGKTVYIHEILLTQTTEEGDAQAEMLGVLIKRGVGATSGSGGSTQAGVPHMSTGTGAPTAETLNTTQASAGSGSLTTIRADGFNVQGGYQYLPPPEQRLTFIAAEMLVVSIEAPADSTNICGTLVIEVID